MADFRGLITQREQMISDAEANIAVWQQDIEALKRAQALWDAASADGSKPLPVKAPVENAASENQKIAIRKAGRQPGQISKEWHATLQHLFESGGAASYEAIQAVAATHLVKGNMNAIRDRVRHFLKLGYISGGPEGFAVTEEAAERFGFSKKNEAPGKWGLPGASVEDAF